MSSMQAKMTNADVTSPTSSRTPVGAAQQVALTQSPSALPLARTTSPERSPLTTLARSGSRDQTTSSTIQVLVARCSVLKTSTLLANQHTVSASYICVNVYKMCIKGQPCWERIWVVLRTSDQSLGSNGGTQCTRSSSNSGLNVVEIQIMFHVIY